MCSIQRKKRAYNAALSAEVRDKFKAFYTPHLWMAQGQTTTYGIFYEDKPYIKGFRNN